MNIFKVLASTPRNSFLENQVSAFFAWLLNPHMDHGLSFQFLIKFLERIEFKKEDIIKKLRPDMSDKNDCIDVKVNLEYKIDNIPIDILLKIEGYYFSIENKIYSNSASNKEQLKTQYQCFQGTKRLEDCKSVIMVFIVPDTEGDKIKNEYNNLVVDNTDEKRIISWKEISEDIQEILKMEQNCQISPIDEYLRNTLKSFSVFIKDDFKGYIYNKINTNRLNEKAIGKVNLKGIRKDENITFIGVQNGKAGLLKMKAEELKNKEFQYTNGQIQDYQWIKKDEFLELVNDIESKENSK